MTENHEGDKGQGGPPRDSSAVWSEIREEIIRDVYKWSRTRWQSSFKTIERYLSVITVGLVILSFIVIFNWHRASVWRGQQAEHAIRRGVEYLHRGDFDSAKSLFDAVINSYAPRAPDGYRYRGELLVRRGVQERDGDLVKAAIRDLTKAVLLDDETRPDTVLPESHFWRGRAYFLQGRFDEAVVDFSRTIQLNPDHVSALVSRSQAYVTQRRFAESLSDLNRAMELDPSFSTIYGQRATIHFAQRELDKALVDCNMRITLGLRQGPDCPDLGDAYFQRGNVLLLLQRYDEAIADYTESIRRHPMFADVNRYRDLARRLKEMSQNNRPPTALDSRTAVE